MTVDPLLYQLLFLALATSPSDDLDRRELAALIRNGDHKAFRTFFDRHHESLYRFLISRGVSEPNAEDLVQQAFVMIWEKRSEIDETKSLRAYLFKIAYSRMLNHFRDRSKFTDSDPERDEHAPLTPEDHTRHLELLSQIENAVKAMPERRRMVFECFFMQGFTYRETARTLEITRKTVENHMALALKDIREALGEFKSE